MAEIKFGKTVTLKQAASLIKANPTTKFMLQGEPGIGKTSILKPLAKSLGYEYAYIDVPNMDLGDIAMPVIDRETKTTTYYPNARFKLHTGKPVLIVLDEFSKGADPVKNMLHPLVEETDPRLGDVPLNPPDLPGQPTKPKSIVVLTGNMSSDGVGDSLKAHSRNRIVPLHVSKPNHEEWKEWGIEHDISPEVLAWVDRFPHVLDSYLNYPDLSKMDNPYVFNPKSPQLAFVSPRSLTTASNITKNRSLVDPDSLIAALSGAIGEAGARDLQAFIAFADQLPTWEATVTDPDNAPVPTSPGACSVVVFGALARITKETMTPFMKYLSRFEPEWQAAFAINIAKSPTKQSVAFSCRAFADFVAANQDLF